MLLRHNEPQLYLHADIFPWQTPKYLSTVIKFQDYCSSFASQTISTDVIKVTKSKECVFRNYEKEKLYFFRKSLSVILDTYVESEHYFNDTAKEKLEILETDLRAIDGHAKNM